ncbi:MAG: hypothetical protein FWD47_05185 [Treponema sp.]|nr:hypothetical protein [Treponema sp.]
MKIIIKIFGKIIFFSIILLVITACDDEVTYSNNNGNSQIGGSNNNNSIFTLTNIPSKYNGKFAKLDGASLTGSVKVIYGYYLDSYVISYVPISNGSVSIPIWERWGHNYLPFNDTRPYVILIKIYEKESLNSNENLLAEIIFSPVNFTNNSVTKSWNDPANIYEY